MDVVTSSPTGEEYLLDASVHNPLAERYALAAFSCLGFVPNCSEQDKQIRYLSLEGRKSNLA